MNKLKGLIFLKPFNLTFEISRCERVKDQNEFIHSDKTSMGEFSMNGNYLI